MPVRCWTVVLALCEPLLGLVSGRVGGGGRSDKWSVALLAGLARPLSGAMKRCNGPKRDGGSGGAGGG